MSHVYRRCSKCGANQVSNPELRMHRFPTLGKNKENVYQLMSWAMFCYPDKDWFDFQALADLQKSYENEENLHSPRAGPSHSNICNVLRTQSHTVMSVTEEPTAEIKTESVTSGSFAARSQTVTEELSADTKTESVPSVSFLKKESSQNKEKLSASENKVYNKCKYLLKQVNKLKTALKQKKGSDVLQVLHKLT
ncbi:unnamed protein product [Colias eurytheme]|nr:unnamed protein product [Colias eurytheme]